MSAVRPRRWPFVLGFAAVVVAALLFLGMRAALRAVETELTAALGPGAEIGAMRVDATTLEIADLRIPAPSGWPAADALLAERVQVSPSWRALLSGRIEIARVRVEKPYLSILRSRDGHLRLLPSLLENDAKPEQAQDEPDPGQKPSEPTLAIAEIELTGGTVELFDATVAREPWKIRCAELEARVGDVVVPALDARTPLEVRGVLDGPQRDGRVSLQGWLVAATRDLELRLDLSGIDLLALEPYLVEAAKARLARGSLDLGVSAKVADRQLHAPGRLALSNLAFARGGRASAKVLGVPRDLLLATLQAKGGRIELDFSLDGRIDDPKFSLQETASTRIAVALAKELGVSVSGLVEGTVGLGLEGLEGAGRAAGGIGSKLRKLVPR